MQPTNKARAQYSRCMYCGSTDYGKGCRYGPHGVHLHSDAPGKCVYCGSPNFGKGCKINPTNDLHIHGISYNSMFREQLQGFLTNEILLKELKKDFTQFECYQLGIIDKQGNKIKAPITEAEHSSFSPLTKTILRIKKYLGPKIELLELKNLAENQINFTEDLIKYEKMLTYKDKVTETINELYSIFETAQKDGFSLEEIKKLIQA